MLLVAPPGPRPFGHGRIGHHQRVGRVGIGADIQNGLVEAFSLAGERLVGEDESLLSAILWSLLNPLEMLYFELLEGNVDDAYFAARLNGLAVWLDIPSARAVFDAYRSTLDARFVDHVERFMRERQRAP